MGLKILTITCHNVYNHGASLQQLALLEYLISLGHDAKTINYKPSYLANHFNFLAINNPTFERNYVFKLFYILLKFPFRLIERKRKRKFDSFENDYIKILPKKYTSNQELINDLPIADVYICGSDQVWNSYFQNGKDPAFYLDFVPNDKLKISYAASFAIDAIDPTLQDFVREKISRLDWVSVREASGVKMVQDLGIENVTQVFDPVFLVEPAYWESFVKPLTERYIFVYDFDTNVTLREFALQQAKARGLQIYTVNNNIRYADKNFYLHGPDVFLSLVHGADLVLTNSFHAVAFSLIFQKQFIVFNRSENINTRMRDLLILFNLDYLLVDNSIEFFYDSFNVDYSVIKCIMETKIFESKLFLNNALQNF